MGLGRSQSSWVNEWPIGRREPARISSRWVIGAAIRGVRDIALEIELHAGLLRDLPRLHLDHDQGLAIRTLLAPDGDRGIEKPRGAHQVARIAFGQHDQAGQFVIVQVRDFAVTPQFQMLLQQRAHR